MSNHTPGPWRVDPHHRGDIQTQDGETEIACAWSERQRGNSIKVPENAPVPDLQTRRANAILIAAAPDLLQAALVAYATIGTNLALGRLGTILRDAIVKATGGEQ